MTTSEQVIEEVSALVHEAWMTSKRESGVTSRLFESGEELMVPYDQLSESAKDLDRVTVQTVLDAADRIGLLRQEMAEEWSVVVGLDALGADTRAEANGIARNFADQEPKTNASLRDRVGRGAR